VIYKYELILKVISAYHSLFWAF